jgi:hypothetical protein
MAIDEYNRRMMEYGMEPPHAGQISGRIREFHFTILRRVL